MPDIRMGSNIYTATSGLKFSDGTTQLTAASDTATGLDNAGNTETLSDTGINVTDVFGNQFIMQDGLAGLIVNNGGDFFAGTGFAGVGDGSGDSLLFGLNNQNISLGNQHNTSGFINPEVGGPGLGDTSLVLGNPVQIGSLTGSAVFPVVNPATNLSISAADGTTVTGTFKYGGVTMPTVAPTAGQVLTATSATVAGWANPAGGPVIKSQRVHVGVVASATPSAITTLTWASPFADNNYTVIASVTIAETPPNGAATEIITVGSMQLSASGVGLTFVVCNASSGVHDVTVNFLAQHD